ncbi:MAG: TetR/AcrR family transcriptional regulator [Pseudomonadota bacterium]
MTDAKAAYLAIATRKFAADGYHGASLAALANEAGVTKQALLHFFGSKERLYAEVLAGLAERLCEEVDAATVADPAAHLTAYFTGLAERAETDDARLVIRALLDSPEEAGFWPMKPFLDRLLRLAGRTQGGAAMEEEEALARLFAVIGAIQYFAISQRAISGMYGWETSEGAAAAFKARIAESVRELAAGGVE